MYEDRHAAAVPFRRRRTAAGRRSGAPRGTLFLVVGPSGAGKDTLIRGARRVLARDARFEFARRVITRPAPGEDGGEFHLPVDAAEFDRLEREGAFCLSWRAHGLAYGIPAGIADRLAGGRSVIANASRTVVASARASLEPVCVIHVTAPHEVLAARLRSREREDAQAIASRLRRAGARVPDGAGVIELRNDAPPEEGVRRLVSILLSGTRGSDTPRTASGVVVREPGLPLAAAKVLP